MSKPRRNIGQEILTGIRQLKRGRVGRVVTLPPVADIRAKESGPVARGGGLSPMILQPVMRRLQIAHHLRMGVKWAPIMTFGALISVAGVAEASNRPLPWGTPGPPPDSSKVVVKWIEESLPLNSERPDTAEWVPMDPISQFLWDTFANQPEEMQFRFVTTRDLKAKCRSFARSLVAKAREQNLDAASLDSCLVRVGDKGLPVGAYATGQGSRPVWIIVVKWEYGSDEHPANLEHIRVHAFDARDFSQVGFITCD